MLTNVPQSSDVAAQGLLEVTQMTTSGLDRALPANLKPRLTDFSALRQGLVRLCQSMNYGEINNLAIRNGEPFSRAPDA